MNATILVVDDEKNVLSSLTRVLQPSGYRVLQAESGQQALNTLRDHEVDLVISDMRMPGMDGAELLQQIAATYKHIRRIILTGYGSVERAIAAINEGGVNRYLTKPWNNTELRSIIEEELAKAQKNRQLEQAFREMQHNEAHLRRKLEASANLLSCSSELMTSSQFDHLVELYKTLAKFKTPEKLQVTGKVVELVGKAADELGLTVWQKADLERAAKVHRFGELALPDDIAEKCFLDHTTWEGELYRRYPEITLSMMTGCNQAVASIIADHRKTTHDGDVCWKQREILRVSTEFAELMHYKGSQAEDRAKTQRFLSLSAETRYPTEILEAVVRIAGEA